MSAKAGNFKKFSNNPVLVEPEVGKTKRSVYDLPSTDFTFGKKLQRDPEGAGEVILTWKEHEPNPDAVPGRDFVALNRHSAMEKISTAKGITEYRKTHDARLPTGHDARNGKSTVLPSDRNIDHSYGIRTRPSTPVGDLIQSRYQMDWYNQQMEKEEAERAAIEASKSRDFHTRSTVLLQRSRSVSPSKSKAESFRMKQFENVPPKVVFPK
eukprot:TRINITY_DN1266_c0_g1_i1.p1 TRINITY_DN1266_c0_g1~~TRINITY_DN1266_c0_g1_i1.p1  ORF type:complete len:235 (-),score=54.70 TRINITY_DN1266_c0_g1_i1:52-684(-)